MVSSGAILTALTETGQPVYRALLGGLIGVMIITALVDSLILSRFQRLNRPDSANLRYFCLHFFFNAWMVWVIWADALIVLYQPVGPRAMVGQPYIRSALISTSGVAGFHLYHLLAYSNLSLEDWLHHLISGIGIPFGVLLPFGRIPNLSNLGMCGLPGGVDYFLLILVKTGWLDPLTEKFINRWLNLILRWPIQLLTTYLIILNVSLATPGQVSFPFKVLMVAIGIIHSINAIYYADKVVGNYHMKARMSTRKISADPIVAKAPSEA